MKIIKYSEILKKENLIILKEIIFNDGIIIYPTDTLYGIGGNFFSVPVIKKIDFIKKRNDLPYSVTIPGIDMLERLVDHIPVTFHKINKKLLPGKFTFLFNASKSINRKLLKGNNKIGIRIPNIPKILKLIEFLNIPLISTSANKSGSKPLNDPELITKEFGNIFTENDTPLLIDAGPLPESMGSTILDITVDPIKIVRKGDDFNKFLELI